MKLFISGYGKMGRMIEKIILSKGLEYAGWTEAVTETDPVLARECVCIDFTTPAAFRENYRFLAENFKASPCVFKVEESRIVADTDLVLMIKRRIMHSCISYMRIQHVYFHIISKCLFCDIFCIVYYRLYHRFVI